MCDIGSRASGTMTVIRVTTARVGGVITRLLKAFLAATEPPKRLSSHGAIWKRPQQKDGKWPAWQRFDIIGDFGQGDQQKLSSKLSPWFRSR